ncbi:hypothetical protein FB451DRAFT_1561345 [Mycena latifolia]|nr:hypothetical protein FB451DRAFT_1561345 [Mycena latifolia]
MSGSKTESSRLHLASPSRIPRSAARNSSHIFCATITIYEPKPPERDERETDKFHTDHILEPAAVIATSMLGKPVVAGFAPNQNDTIGDLMITVERRPCITAESKRGVVFMTHLFAFLKVAERPEFPWLGPDENPPEAVRMWIQIWAQMVEYKVYYAKLFSPLGTVYIYRKGDVLWHSKVYDDMDGNVLRTTSLILLSQIPPSVSLVTRVVGAVARRPIVQSIFSWFTEAVIRVALIVGTISGSPKIAA